MTRSLSPDELIALLDGWAGGGVAVRIVSPPGELVAIFEGRLGTRSGAKDPSAFWALEAASTPTGAEQPGLLGVASQKTRRSAQPKTSDPNACSPAWAA